MYYNGCKYARSKTVRKFRLSVKSEEAAIEDHMNLIATLLAPVFKQVCPRSYDNQTKYEHEDQSPVRHHGSTGEGQQDRDSRVRVLPVRQESSGTGYLLHASR